MDVRGRLDPTGWHFGLDDLFGPIVRRIFRVISDQMRSDAHFYFNRRGMLTFSPWLDGTPMRFSIYLNALVLRELESDPDLADKLIPELRMALDTALRVHADNNRVVP